MILCAKTDNRGRGGGERACPEDIITKPYWGEKKNIIATIVITTIGCIRRCDEDYFLITSLRSLGAMPLFEI